MNNKLLACHLIGIANHLKACPAYEKLLSDVEYIERAAAELRQLDEWPSFDSAPKTGEFLVYMPDEHRKVQVMYRHRNVDLIGDTFAFDRKTPARWHLLPALPE